MKYTFLAWLLLPALLQAQAPAAEKKYRRLVNDAFMQDSAFRTVGFVEQRWRVVGNKGFNESIRYVEGILQRAGFSQEINGEINAPLTYRIEKRPMKNLAWDPIDAQLFIAGEKEPLLSFTTNRNMLAMNAASTPPEGVTAELVYVGRATDKDWENINVKGKIVMGESYIGSLYSTAVKKGALGVLSYGIPRYNEPQKHPESITFQGIPYTDSATQKWGILLSYAAREKLKAALAKGPVSVRVVVTSHSYPSVELTLVANVRGSEKPQERFVFSAHVQEPGANDNASGVGALAEMARVTAQLVINNKIAPQRTITFLWGDEIVSTDRYIKDDSIRAKGIKWGMSLDMVGEDTKKTGGTFLIEKMPDPSAIWTRGNDKHTEWGGSALKEADMFPHYFNDLLLNRCRYEASKTGWVVNTNPFEGGSDHTPFLNAKIPGLLMWHFTDVYYHTDGDRLNMVSAAELKHVGISGLTTAYLLTTANTKTAVALINDLTKNALARLQTEFAEGRKAISAGGNKAHEQHILEVWCNWYVKALESTVDIAVVPKEKVVAAAIRKAQQTVQQQAASYIKML